MTETEKAYLAGLIDGEGCIMMVLRGSRTNRCDVRVTITNTSPEMLKWITDRVPFSHMTNWHEYQNKPNWKLRATVIWSCRKAIDLLRIIEPYLVIKRMHAQVCLSYYELVLSKFDTVSEENVTRRMELWTQLRQLNKKGR